MRSSSAAAGSAQRRLALAALTGTCRSSTSARKRSAASATTGAASSSSATGWTSTLLREAGIEDADAVVVATDGDNSNIVIGQMAQQQFGVGTVVVRILDPARAEFYARAG